MSKLVDKLRRVSESYASPIGFRSSASQSMGSAMLLVGGFSEVDASAAEVMVNTGVDAGLIFERGTGSDNLTEMVKVMGDIPLGMFLGEATMDGAERLAESGCDFVVFDVKAPMAGLHEGGIGKFLAVEPSMDVSLVRAINGLGVDGVLISRGTESFITVEYLLLCQRLGDLVDKPLLVALASMTTSKELDSLWQAGIDGIVAPPGQGSEQIMKLKEMIDGLPTGNKRRRGKAGVIVPHYGSSLSTGEEEEEEEEEEI
jgi:hypothetical protein